jgi:hypothetical protein
MEIVRTGNIALIAKSNCDLEKCFTAWENVLEKNSKVTGNYSYQTNLDSLRSLTAFLNEYITVKAILIKLQYVVDDEDIAWLNERGYVIETNGFTSYVNSLNSTNSKSNNLVTKIKSKQKELLRQVKEGAQESEYTSFQQVIANLSAKLQFAVPETITLPAYNEYIRLIKLKEKHGGTNRR